MVDPRKAQRTIADLDALVIDARRKGTLTVKELYYWDTFPKPTLLRHANTIRQANSQTTLWPAS